MHGDILCDAQVPLPSPFLITANTMHGITCYYHFHSTKAMTAAATHNHSHSTTTSAANIATATPLLLSLRMPLQQPMLLWPHLLFLLELLPNWWNVLLLTGNILFSTSQFIVVAVAGVVDLNSCTVGGGIRGRIRW